MTMEQGLIVLIVILVIAVAVGRFWQYRSTKKKIDQMILDIKIDAKAKEKILEQEVANRLQALDEQTEHARERSNAILKKAIDYAFNFEKEITSQHQTAQKEIQKVLDDTFRFKRKVLLNSITLRNFETKLEQIRKERDIYLSLLAQRDFFVLNDNSDWDEVEKEFRDKVLQLQAAQDEKEAQNEIKRQMREEQRRADELEQQQQQAEEKERELEDRKRLVEQALLAASEDHKKELEETKRKLEQEIKEVHKQYERAKSMAQMTKQGHVYVISNIGSFGENVFKIGMTRRLEPMDRVSELSSASVPFEFDVHAMINCDDAPALENVLHNELKAHRINKVNLRKEFFNTDIESIIRCVESHHGKVEYIANPAAIQYYRTQEINEDDPEVAMA
jgi:hypothetical protein